MKEKQTLKHSFMESITNIVLGGALSVLVTFSFFPMFGWAISLDQSIALTLMFSALSLVRGFTVRRFFIYIGKG